MFWESRQNKDRRDRQCSFCGKRENVVKSLIESPAPYHCHTCQTGSSLLICNECVRLCSTFLAEGAGRTHRAERLPSADDAAPEAHRNEDHS